MKIQRLMIGVACLAVAACGATGSQRAPGTAASARDSHTTAAGRSSSYRAPAQSDEKTSAAAPPAPSAPSADAYKSEPAPLEAQRREERPGLGTTFGETRASQVHDVPFERASDTPFAVASVFYNDRDGVAAMASYAARRAARLDAGVPMRGGLTVSVVDESGAPLETLSLGGRVYVTGEAGRRYALVLRNHTNRRYEAVVSVDGLDVVDGLAASTGKRGYLIEAWGSVTIDGYRRSYEEVAAFRFGAVSHSYAARTSPSGDRDVGVIGLAFFGEHGVPAWSDNEIERRHAAEPFTDARFSQPPL